MTVLILDKNLIWSARLQKAAETLGHLAVIGEANMDADVAILPLRPGCADTVYDLHARGIKVVGHAGHKEKDLLYMGKTAGCDAVVTNSELTFKLDQVLAGLFPASKS